MLELANVVNELIDLTQRIPSAALAFCVALLVTYIPGFALLQRFAAFKQLDLMSRLFIAPGISIALYTILFSFSFALNIKLGTGTPWLIIALALAAFFVDIHGGKLELRNPLQCYLNNPLEYIRDQWRQSKLNDRLAFVLLCGVCIAAMVTRLYVVRNLVAPTGSDSVHHTLIVQLMLENNGLFQSWLPYVDSSSFTYHFGFHAITTIYAWMRGISAEFAVITMGQVLNAAAVLAVYALVRQWLRSMWGAVMAIIIAAFISVYPAHFVDFGRFTQLTGQIAMISALVLLNHFLAQRRSRANLAFYVVLPIVIAGVGLAQYQVAMIFIIMALPLVIFRFIEQIVDSHSLRSSFLLSIGRTFTIGILALLLFLPRGVQVLGLNTTASNRINRTLTLPLPEVQIGYNAIPDPITFLETGFENQGIWILAMVVCGMGIAVIRRRQALWFCAGSVLIVLAMNPRIVGIQRFGLIDPIHLSLTNYIFVSTLSALAIGFLVDQQFFSMRSTANWLVFSAGLAIAVLGISQYPEVSRTAILVYPDDLQMMECIRNNVPSQERIAVRGSFYFDNTVLMGDDAGWWVPYYTRHRVNLLPLEVSGVPIAESQESKAFFKALSTRDLSTVQSAGWLKENGIRYFFIGGKPSSLVTNPENMLSDQLLKNPALSTVCQAGSARLMMLN
jgi:hypothetical protein